MKNSRTLVIALAGIALFALFAAGCTAPSPKAELAEPAPANVTKDSQLAVGDSVAAVWTDGNSYLAKVEKVDGSQVTVKYVDDGSTRVVPLTDITPITAKTWAVGDKVLAVWSSGRFYAGKITAANGSTYTVAWDDGSAPSDVTADKILAAP